MSKTVIASVIFLVDILTELNQASLTPLMED